MQRVTIAQLLGEALTAELVDKGLLVDAGWLSLQAKALRDVPEGQRNIMRTVFFLGAQHAFHIVTALNEDAEGLRVLEQIDAELRRFIAEFEARYLPTKGNA